MRGGVPHERNTVVRTLKSVPTKAITPSRAHSKRHNTSRHRCGPVKCCERDPPSLCLPPSHHPSLPPFLSPSLPPSAWDALAAVVPLCGDHGQPPPRSTPTVGWWSGETGVLTERNTVSEASGGGETSVHRVLGVSQGTLLVGGLVVTALFRAPPSALPRGYLPFAAPGGAGWVRTATGGGHKDCCMLATLTLAGLSVPALSAKDLADPILINSRVLTTVYS